MGKVTYILVSWRLWEGGLSSVSSLSAICSPADTFSVVPTKAGQSPL